VQQIRARTVPPFIRLTTLLAALAMATAACSSGATSPSASGTRPSSSSTNAVHGRTGNGSRSGGNGSKPGSSTGGGKGRNGVTTTTTGPSGNGKSTGVTTTTIGIPPLSQQFATDDSAFEAVLNSAQTAVRNLPPATTAQQVVQAMQPLMAAANLYQSQIVNLQWSAAAKPSAQSLTEDVGQLTADIVGLAGQQAAGFFPVAQFVSKFSSAATAVRSVSKSIGAQIGLR
jgi:hypothetical protein